MDVGCSSYQNRLPRLIGEVAAITKQIFSCLLDTDYTEQLYLYEHRLHDKKIKFLKTLLSLQHLNDPAVQQIETIFMLTMRCAMLRWEVSDHTLFAVCHDELLGLSVALTETYAEIVECIKRQKIFSDTNRVAEKIQRLEDNYQHVLKVTAREPLVILLFIASLKALDNEIAAFGAYCHPREVGDPS